MNLVPQPHFLPVDWWALGAGDRAHGRSILLLLLEFLPPRPNGNRGPLVALATLVAAGYCAFHAQDDKRSLFDGMFVHDGLTVFFTLLFCVVGALAVLFSWQYAKRTRIGRPEYYALLLSSILGMVVMAASNDLITIFLGLELMSLSLYVLVGFRSQPARVERGRAQVLPARRVRVGLPAVRHRAALRRDRHHQPAGHRPVPRRHAARRTTVSSSVVRCWCSRASSSRSRPRRSTCGPRTPIRARPRA
jgi:hypothetical protein